MIKRGNMDKALKNYHNAIELLSKYDNDEIVPESEGISAGRLTEFINSSILKHSKP